MTRSAEDIGAVPGPVTDPPPAAARPRATRREDLLTMVFATWLIVGIFVDGWAHSNDKPETFFTPWHALFYSGFVTTALWMTWMVQRRRAQGAQGLAAAVPVGYGLGLLGVAVFAFGGVFDMVWHTIFGIEVDLEALLSPSHLLLFGGGLLVTTSPLRSAWHNAASRDPGFREFLPVLLSATITTASVAFFLMVFSPLLTGAMTGGPYHFASMLADRDLASWLVEEVQLEGYAAILLTTIILLAPALLLIRRWTVPFGTFAFLFGVVATLTAAIESFDFGPAFLAPLIAGVVADVLYRRLRPGHDRPWALRAWATAVPPVMWLAYFGLLAAFRTVGWSVELWAGVTVMTGLTGFALALLMTPPPVPAELAPASPAAG